MTDMLSIVKSGRYIIAAMLLLQFVGVVVADDDISNISSALSEVCTQAKNILFIGVMLLVILGAAVYAIGQIMGAETRARASVWATAMFTGAIIGIIIYIVVPWFLGMLSSEGDFTC